MNSDITRTMWRINQIPCLAFETSYFYKADRESNSQIKAAERNVGMWSVLTWTE